MSATNLELCVAAVRSWATGAPLSFAAAEVTDGRRAPVDGMGTKHLHLQRDQGAGKSEALVGAWLRTYVLECELFAKGTDTKEEDSIDETLQGYVEALHDAFHGRGYAAFPTLDGLEVIEAEVVDRDPDAAKRTAQRAVVRLTFPFYEVR